MASLATRPGVEVRADEWEGHNFHDQSRSRELAEWADIVVAEWCLGNAVWFSHHLPPRTALVIRLHRVELETTYPRELDLDNVHRIIAVSPKFAGLVRDHLPALGDRVVYLPNAVDCALLDKPKLGGSEYRLGLLGGAPKRKRLDLALDMLDALRRRDRRYVLSVKGKLATEYPWAWREQEERAYFHEQMARINHAPWRDSVVFEPFGSDVDVWFRKIGFILSPSDDESFHLSIAEGMAAGSVPIIRRREEVPGLYPPDYVYTDNHQAVALIEHLRQDELPLSARGESLKRWVCDQFDTRVVTKRWHELLVQVYEEVAG
jgi:glycosyltransferase involved in cell wall biosynthesis